MQALRHIDEKAIYYNSITIPYEVIKSNRKSLAIAIAPGGKVTVRIPNRATRKDVIQLLSEKSEWIYKAFQEQLHKKINGFEIKEGVILPFLDRTFRLHIEHNPYMERAKIEVREDQEIDDKSKDGDTGDKNYLDVITPQMDHEFIKECVESWYKKNAKNIIQMRVEFYANIMGVTYGRISIRSQKSRWGSCSSTGNLNFNWHLVMMPIEVLDYVVIHELAHRLEMNHSKQFWEEVNKVCPAYKRRKDWLKMNGAKMRLY